MGSCQGSCTQNQKENEITMEHKEKLKNGVNSFSSTSQRMKTLDDTISEEMNSKTTALPPFVKKKEIHQSVVVKRTNRFMNDLELEVKSQIRKIQQEEEENKRVEELKHRYEQKQMEQSGHSGLAQDPSFSFQNSMKRLDTVISNPYQPKQTSQFAPKKEGDTISQKSQMSKTAKSVSPKSQSQSQNLDMVKKAALKRIQTMKDELVSNNASRGSRNTKAQVDAFEKIFSEYCSQDHSSSKSKKSVKSILKHNRSMSSVNISMSKYSVKSTRTIKKSKKVRFTGDTNFNNERKSQIQRRNWWDL